MMTQVACPQVPTQTVSHLSRVHIRMDQVEDEIASDKPRSDERPCMLSEEKAEHNKEHGRDRDTHHWWEYDAKRIAGVLMVHAMNHKMKPLASAARRLPVKQPPVQSILGQGPQTPPESEE